MIGPELVPEVVWRAAMMTYHREIRRNPQQAWQIAIAAALNAWPGVFPTEMEEAAGVRRRIILPLPKEPSNG